MERDELLSYLALSLSNGIGPRRLIALYDYFGSAKKILDASPHEITHIPGIGEGIAEALSVDRHLALAEAEDQLARLPEDGCIVTYYDRDYPDSLRTIHPIPPLLFVRGNREILQYEKMIAIVGSRKTTDYGRRNASEFGAAMAKHNVLVVSGFAKGIDSVAQQSAFNEGGKTIAVLGSGVDVIYPSTNNDFANELIESGRGAIVSELPLSTQPLAHNFPARNRIVSGLSRATVVVESERKGGSLITAWFALDQNRDVYAIPGDIYRSSSSGPNLLIQEARAKLATSPEEILMDLGWLDKPGQIKKQPIDRNSLSLFENKIVDVLESAGGPLQVDQLAERAELEVQDVLVHLLNLEFKSVVRQMAGKQFMLV